MTRRHTGFWFRLCGSALLLLALLPVTAPFSTFDLIDFFRDTPVDASSLTQAKPDAQKLASVPTAAVRVHLAVADAARYVLADARPAIGQAPSDIPLRL